MKNNIFLIGFMGSGKSTVAKNLQRLYGMPVIEMDHQIETEQGKSIPQIFATEGESAFRRYETELLSNIKPDNGSVISCGGGVATRQENVDLMKERGIVIYLTAEPETIYERVRHSHHRPLLEGNMTVEYIQSLMDKRRDAYEAAADLKIPVDHMESARIAEKIYHCIREDTK